MTPKQIGEKALNTFNSMKNYELHEKAAVLAMLQAYVLFERDARAAPARVIGQDLTTGELIRDEE